MGFYLTVFLFVCITVISVCGVFILTGLTGMFSLGQGAFMALGAYTTGLSMISFGLPFPIALIVGVLTGMITALIVGIPTLKLRRDYFVLVTFGFGEAVAGILNLAIRLTGGAVGLIGIPRATTPALVIISAILIIIMTRHVKYSRFGRICIAIKNDELTARSFGVNVFAHKMKVFILSAALSAYAGGLYAALITFVEPAMFRWIISAEWVIFVFFGGVNSLTGTITAAFFLSILPETLRFAREFQILIYTILVLLILNFRPKGLFGSWELSPRNIMKIFRSIKRRLFSRQLLDDGGLDR